MTRVATMIRIRVQLVGLIIIDDKKGEKVEYDMNSGKC